LKGYDYFKGLDYYEHKSIYTLYTGTDFISNERSVNNFP